jgi:hypothetical protein
VVRGKLITIGTAIVEKLTVVRMHSKLASPLQDLVRRIHGALVPG